MSASAGTGDEERMRPGMEEKPDSFAGGGAFYYACEGVRGVMGRRGIKDLNSKEFQSG